MISIARLRRRRRCIGRHRTRHDSTVEIRERGVRSAGRECLPGGDRGALSLKGKEIAEVLRDRNSPPLTSACSMTMNLSVNWRRLATR